MLHAVSLLCALGLAAVRLFAGSLRVLEGIPGGRWRSFAGGASVAHVVVHLLPEHRRSRFWAFALGAAGYAALLLAP